MPELNHRFQKGKMNKDLDERLVPNGEYRDALNIQVATSEGSDVGSLQTILGNLDVSSASIDPDFLNSLDFSCVGSIVDEKNNKIFWLISGTSKDIIAEYDYNTKKITPVLIDIFPAATFPASDSGRVLNFDKSFLITGINVIDDYLFWTDNITEPKSINITRSKLGTPDFNTHSRLFVTNKDTGSLNPPFVDVGDVQQSHITVIKKSPQIAPKLEMKNTTRADVDSDGVVGNIITTISFPDPTVFIDTDDNTWSTNIITIGEFGASAPASVVDGVFDTPVDFQVGDFIEFTPVGVGLIATQSTKSIVVEIIERLHVLVNTVVFGITINLDEYHYKIEVISGDVTIGPGIDTYDVKLRQNAPLFKFKFPRFGYRYKYEDQQYSAFSPFSEVAFMPSEFNYIPKEGYNLGMVNDVRLLAVRDFVDTKLIPKDVVSIDILYKESNSPVIYSVETIKKVNNISGDYDNWNATNSSANAVGNITTTGYLNITSEVIHKVLPSNQLLRLWDNVPRRALAQEIVGNRLVYGNYLQNYNLSNAHQVNPSHPTLPPLPPNNNITVDLKLSYISRAVGSEIPEQFDPAKAHDYIPSKSIKTLRTYQLGVVYIDEFGRETPVFSASKNSRNSIQLPKSAAENATKLKAHIKSAPPDFAKAFKFLIKESSNEYYNLALDRWYFAEDGNIWLSFPSSERNKVDLETFLILKKQHSNNVFVSDRARYKILAIENEAPLFIKTKRITKGNHQDVIDTSSPAYHVFGEDSYSTSNGYPMPEGTSLKLLYNTGDYIDTMVDKIIDNLNENWEFRLKSVGEGASKWYGIKSVTRGIVDGLSHHKIVSKKPFGVDMGVTSPIAGNNSSAWDSRYVNNTVEFARKEIKDLPEFDGKFFVKILNDSAIKENVIGYTLDSNSDWTPMISMTSEYIYPQDPWNYNGAYSAGGFFGCDIDGISIEEIGPIIDTGNYNDNSKSHACHINNLASGQTYWSNIAKPSGNGRWFIDKIEGFRPYKLKNRFSKYADTWFTQDFNSWPNFLDPINQLCVMGTNTWTGGTFSNYLNQGQLNRPIDSISWDGFVKDQPASDWGNIVSSVGIDTATNVIHLSYAGVGDDEADPGIATNTHYIGQRGFNYFAHDIDYVQDIAFITALQTPGTVWRWKDDPDKIVYKTEYWDSSTDQTSDEWKNNTIDFKDSEDGVFLYNYTRFSDFFSKHYKTWTGGISTLLVPAPDIKVPLFGFVSQNIADHYDSSSVNYYLGSTFYAALFPTANAAAHYQQNDDSSYASAGGWNSYEPAHFRYPNITAEAFVSKNRRRRFQIRARSLATDANGVPYNLGAAPNPDLTGDDSFYLPTNDPELSPHLALDGTPLTSSTTPPIPTNSAGVPTKAPGIRPDGMPSGHTDPTGGYTFNGVTHTTIPPARRAMIDSNGNYEQIDNPSGSVTWEILERYYEDDDNDFINPNPAIWETEPKEDIDLDIYHEVGEVYPIKLIDSTLEQYIGPIRDDLFLNSSVKCYNPSGIDVEIKTGALVSWVWEENYDIRVANVREELYQGQQSILLQLTSTFGTLMNETNPIHLAPSTDDKLTFTKADGSTTSVTIRSTNTDTTLTPIVTDFILWPDVHNYEVELPWFNCYSFGNGVESNRIRDDYNQVTIDKGPKVSTTLEEPYAEEHKASGLIYSGIYNSDSGINNLNQFIQAEKITKDLNPTSGSIQKLYTRDTNLVTFCEDKVFKILANKDALFNADGNPQLISTDRVLGQTIPFSGDYGISTNPESFATESFRMYFTDRARGSVLRLSQDGLTPISSIGMTDWFSDNLTDSNRLIGTYDERKKEYNLSLSYYNYDSYPVGIIGHSKGPAFPPTPMAVLSCSNRVANKLRVGDIIEGPGIPPNTIIWEIINLGGGEYNIKLSQAPTLNDVAPLEPWVNYGPIVQGAVGLDVQWMTRITSSKLEIPSNTISFSEKNRGWVSFKSFVYEDGVSLNNDYYTFKKGQLWEHHDESLVVLNTSTATYNPVLNNNFYNILSFATLPSTVRVGMVVSGNGIYNSVLVTGVDFVGLNITLNKDINVKMGTEITFSAPSNNFYNEQYDSSVEVLFNESPDDVKSFQTLNYEGDQSRITKDIYNTGEYWDNRNKLGWYVSQIYTNLQEGDIHEFKDKEGKWFSQIKGVATEWLDDGTAGNIDTNEFSYQGIDESGAINIISGGYTSWNCDEVLAYPNPCCTGKTTYTQTFGSVSEVTDYIWDNQTFEFWDYTFEIHDINGTLVDVVSFCGGGGGSVMDPSVYPTNNNNITWAGHFTSANFDGINTGTGDDSIANNGTPTVVINNPQLAGGPYREFFINPRNIEDLIQWFIDNVNSTAFFHGMTRIELEQAMNYTPITGSPIINPGSFMHNGGFHAFNTPQSCQSLNPISMPNCIELQGLVGDYLDEPTCLADFRPGKCGDPCFTKTIGIAPIIEAATLPNCIDGGISVNVSGAGGSWTVVYSDPTGVLPDVIDTTTYPSNGQSDVLPITTGPWEATVIDSNGCAETTPFVITCITMSGCAPTIPHQGVVITTITAKPPTCNDGAVSISITTLGGGATSWSVEFFDDNGNSIYQDNGPIFNGGVSDISNLANGSYKLIITDNLGCQYEEDFYISCVSVVQTWDCELIFEGNIDLYDCVDPGTGNGLYTSLAACQSTCVNPPSFACSGSNGMSNLQGVWQPPNSCFDPGTGLGTYTSLAVCNAACGATPSFDCSGQLGFSPIIGPNAGTTIAPWNCFDPGNGQGQYTSIAACSTLCFINPSYDCDGQGNCYDPGNGNGNYATPTQCYNGCPTPSSWDCINGACIDPGNGQGQYTSLFACQTLCTPPSSWDCNGGVCSDPGTGNGSFNTLNACTTACGGSSTPSWNCINNACIDPGTGTGTYTLLSACQNACGVAPSWDCDGQGNCTDPGTGNGTYPNLNACQAICGTPSIGYSCSFHQPGNQGTPLGLSPLYTECTPDISSNPQYATLEDCNDPNVGAGPCGCERDGLEPSPFGSGLNQFRLRNVGWGTGGVWIPNSGVGGTPQDVDFDVEFNTVMLVDCALPTLATVTHPVTGAQVPNLISGTSITVTTFGFHNNIQHFRYEMHYNSTGPTYQDEVDALCSPTYGGLSGAGGWGSGGLGGCGIPSSSLVANTNTLGGNSWPLTATQSISYGPGPSHRGDWTIKFFNDYSIYPSACYDFTIPCNDLQP